MKGLMSPEGVLMLCVAGLLDLTSTICAILIIALGTGGVLNYIVEGLALFIMGGWMFLRYSSLGSEGGMKVEEKPIIETPKRDVKEIKGNTLPKINNANPPKSVPDQAMKSLGKKALKRFGLNFLIESIPFVGCFYPANLVIVWREMQD